MAAASSLAFDGSGGGQLALQSDSHTPALSLDVGGSQANLRVFLEKLALRRKRISCTGACRDAIRQVFRKQLAKRVERSAEHGECSVPYSVLVDSLRNPIKNVPSHVLRELVDVARAYDNGSASVDIDELLSGGLEIETGFLVSHPQIIILLFILVWLFAMTLVCSLTTASSFVEAFYAAVLMLTTVGSIGTADSSPALRLLAVLYVVVGISFAVWALVCCVSAAMLRYETDMLSVLRPRSFEEFGGSEADLDDLMTLEPPLPSLQQAGGLSSHQAADAAHTVLVVSAQEGDKRDGMRSFCCCSSNTKSRAVVLNLVISFVVVLVLIVLGMLLAYFSSSDVNIADALYWSVLTFMTVGCHGASCEFGDSIDGELWHALTAAFVLVSVPTLIFVVLKIGDMRLQHCSEELQTRVQRRVLPMHVLSTLDSSGRGVDKLEFACAMLLNLDKVSARDLFEVLDQFRKLDFHGCGHLGSDDLALLRTGEQRQDGSRPRSADLVFAGPQEVVPYGAPPSSHGNLEFGSMSPVEQTLDPTANSTALNQSSKRQMSVRFAASVGEVLSSAGCPPGEDQSERWQQLEIQHHFPDLPLIKELYSGQLSLRRQLDEKDKALCAVLQTQRNTEQSLQKILAERNSLYGELVALRDARGDLEARLEQSERRVQVLEKETMQELRAKCKVSEERLEATEKRYVEAQREQQTKFQELIDGMTARIKSAEQHAQESERQVAEFEVKLQASEAKCKLQNCVKDKHVEALSAEIGTAHQEEVRNALLERQMALQNDRRRPSPSPTTTFDLAASLPTTPPRLQSGQQPWEVWERAASWSRTDACSRNRIPADNQGNGLLSGKVKDQAVFLDAQTRRLEDKMRQDEPRHLPGWV